MAKLALDVDYKKHVNATLLVHYIFLVIKHSVLLLSLIAAQIFQVCQGH